MSQRNSHSVPSAAAGSGGGGGLRDLKIVSSSRLANASWLKDLDKLTAEAIGEVESGIRDLLVVGYEPQGELKIKTTLCGGSSGVYGIVTVAQKMVKKE